METYVALLRQVLPPASNVNIYDERGELLRSTQLSMSLELSALVEESIAEARVDLTGPGRFKLIGDVPVYLFWLRREDPGSGPPLATLVVRLKAGGDIQARPFGIVQKMVQPTLDVMRQDLTTQERSREGPQDLKSILADAARDMQAGMAALIVPDKGLAIMVAGDDRSLDHRLLAKAHRHLVSVAQMRHEPLIINELSGSGQPVYRLLATPVCRPDGQAMGVLALFRTDTAPAFTARHSKAIEELGRRVANAIAHDYDEPSGVLTSTAFDRRMKQVLKDPKRSPSQWTALCVDIDPPQGGERLLRRLGELIRSHSPPGTLATRVSADRFYMMLPAALDDAIKVGEALRRGAQQSRSTTGSGRVPVLISVGAAQIQQAERDFAPVLARAQVACEAVAQARAANPLKGAGGV
jgi:GGDEF domain-containing protein